MKEKVKRLQPTQHVLRELFLRSGNQCAFPGCYNRMVDEKGNFIGQVCHIEAAEEGGERFNPNMTNEERRAYDNLMLMCYEHHIVTNNVIEYPVEKMKLMKKNHEDMFSGVIQEMRKSVVDYGYTNNYQMSKTCQKLSNVLKYGCTREENEETARILNKLICKMIDVPIETRCLLAIMINRSFEDDLGHCAIPLYEIETVTKKDATYLIRHIDIMQRRELISEPECDDWGRPLCYMCYDRETGWNYWNDIREFCRCMEIPLEKICVELDFSVFD